MISLLLNFPVVDPDMLSTRKMKHQSERLLGHLNETSNHFIIGNYTYVGVAGTQTVKPQIGRFGFIFGRPTEGGNSASKNQVIGRNIADRTRKKLDTTDTAVENWNHDSILTTVDHVVIPRVEMAGT